MINSEQDNTMKLLFYHILYNKINDQICNIFLAVSYYQINVSLVIESNTVNGFNLTQNILANIQSITITNLQTNSKLICKFIKSKNFQCRIRRICYRYQKSLTNQLYSKYIFNRIVGRDIAVSSTVPQIRKALRTKKSDDVSIRFLIILIIGLSLWVVYGIGKNDIVIIIGNSIAVALNIFMLLLKIIYSRNPLDEET